MVSQQGSQWPNAPGIYTDEQTEAWKKVVDSVHKAGGVIFLQVRLLPKVSFVLVLVCFCVIGTEIDCSYGMLGGSRIQGTIYRKKQGNPSLDQVRLLHVEALSTIYQVNQDI